MSITILILWTKGLIAPMAVLLVIGLGWTWNYLKSNIILGLALAMLISMPAIEYFWDENIIWWGNVFLALIMLYLVLKIFRDRVN